jgi:hypothetical protein
MFVEKIVLQQINFVPVWRVINVIVYVVFQVLIFDITILKFLLVLIYLICFGMSIACSASLPLFHCRQLLTRMEKNLQGCLTAEEKGGIVHMF